MLIFAEFIVSIWQKTWMLYDSLFLNIGIAQFTYASLYLALIVFAIIIAIFWRGGSK